MKKYVIIAVLLVSGLTFAQNSSLKLEDVNGLVKATYYYDNGQVEQEGFFKDGKLEGTWVLYNENGSKKAVAEYTNGEKTGKWFFYNQNTVAEVNYSNGTVASVKSLNSAIADKN